MDEKTSDALEVQNKEDIRILPCPFCGWEKIRIIEDEGKEGFFEGTKYTYCWCKVCGARGPWAYSVGYTSRLAVEKCIGRWNERKNR